MWAHCGRGQIAAVAAAMGGIDALTFTGGVGEHQPSMRAHLTDRMAFVGIEADPGCSSAADIGDMEVGNPVADVRVLVVAARAHLIVADQVRRLATLSHSREG